MTIRRTSAALLAALLLAACGASPAEDDDAGSTTAPASFPVTIAHRHGETTVEAPPERVVTVGLTDQDPLLALGVVPVGTNEWFGGHPGSIWPWARDLVGDAELPEPVGESGTILYERISALQPDLILAVYSGLTADEYETLSQIAPTVAQPDEYVDFGVPWQEQTRIVGRVLGRPDEAEALVAEAEGRVEAAREAHPEWDGLEGVMATVFDGEVVVYAPEDVRGRFLTSLGFVQPEAITELAGDEFTAEFSFERIDLLDVDGPVVWLTDTIENARATAEDQPVYNTLPVHTDGREVFVEFLSDVGGASSFVTVLSIPTLLDGLVPALETALDGDPATTADVVTGEVP